MEVESSRATLERNLSMPDVQKQSKAWPYDEHRGQTTDATSPVHPFSANQNVGDASEKG
jgi:hypothetical protein